MNWLSEYFTKSGSSNLYGKADNLVVDGHSVPRVGVYSMLDWRPAQLMALLQSAVAEAKRGD